MEGCVCEGLCGRGGEEKRSEALVEAGPVVEDDFRAEDHCVVKFLLLFLQDRFDL